MKRILLALLLVGGVALTANAPLTIPDGLLGAGDVPAGQTIPTSALALPDPGQGSVQASYDPLAWSGDLKRFDGAGALQWSAAAAMPPSSDRTLYTTVHRSGGESITVELRRDALPPDLSAVLTDTTLGAIRNRPLGAIVHSMPAYAGAPAPAVTGQAYFDFLRRYRSRPPMIYVAANDGLLHAFDAASGVERWAYVPPSTLATLAATRQPPRTLFDGSPAVDDIQTGAVWRTVLATGFGMGTRGVIALDVTDPANFAAGGGEQFSFMPADDDSMGYLLGAPAIVKIRTGTREGLPQYRSFVLTSSGVNSGKPAALFLLALDKPARTAWRRNQSYFRLDVPEADGPLTAPGLALGADGSVQYAYSGDLGGNIWRFDFTGAPPWTRGVSRLFTARDANGQRQPITAAPAIAHAPGGGYMVIFGTGKWLEEQDTDSHTNAPQTLYAVRDTLAHPIHLIGSRATLEQRDLQPAGDAYTLAGPTLDLSRTDGWYIDLANAAFTGERLVTPPQLRDTTAIFTTLLPARGVGVRPASRIYAIDVMSGLLPPVAGDEPQQAGQRIDTDSPVPPLLAFGGVQTDASNGMGRAVAWHTWTFITPGSATPATAPQIATRIPARRLSWREIPNWAELHQAALEEEHQP